MKTKQEGRIPLLASPSSFAILTELNANIHGPTEEQLRCQAIFQVAFALSCRWQFIRLIAFLMNPMQLYELSVMRIGRYLVSNSDKGIIYNVDKSKCLEVYANVDFAGDWSQDDAQNTDHVLLRTGYIIFYSHCPIIRGSKVQTEIAL